MKYFRSAYLLIAVVAAVTASAADSREETVTIFENRKVVFNVPPGIVATVNKDFRGTAAVQMLEPDAKISFTMTLLPDSERQFENARARREKLVELFNEHVGHSTEKGMQFEELEPRTGAGTYCTFTDARLQGKTTLPPGEFLHLTIGVKTWPGVVVIFELLSQDLESKEHQALMTMLRESVQERPVPLR